MIGNLIENIGDDWKGIEDNEDQKEQKNKEEKEENKQEFEGDMVEEWDEEDEMDNLQDPYCYETTKKKTVFHVFINLIGNIQEYNVEKI